MRDLKGSKVLVTGAGGFLARHVVPKLVAQGAEVIGMDLPKGLESARGFKSKAQLVEGDITDSASIERAVDRCNYVIHLAAIAAPLECEKRPETAFRVNVQGTYNVLKFAQRKGVRKVIFSSSAHVYGISPKYMPTDEKHPLALQDVYCYDDQTEVLTNVGWRKFVDLAGTEKVMQLNPSTEEGEMVTPSLFYKKRYDGPMYLYEGKMNFCVTPNHNFWYVAYPRYWANRDASFKLAPVEAMLNHNRVVVKSDVVWKGEQPQDYVIEEYVAMRARGHRQAYSVQARKLPMPTWLRFLGWYVAEGSTDSGKYVRITQKKPENIEEIDDTIKALGWNAYRGVTGVKRDATFFAIGSAQLTRWVHANCYVGEIESSYTKKVPEFIKNLSPSLIEEFLDAYCHGDGTKRTTRYGRSWTTYSEQLGDDIQELVLKAGGVASLRQGYDKKLCVPYWRIYERLRNVLQIKCRQIRRVDYSGMVACVEVPSHILMVRRGGKTMWCGNTTSKIIGESLCQLFYSNHNLEYVTSRLYNAYGPGQNEDYFIPAMISKAKTGRIELRGRAVTKDFVFVEDVADAFVKALTSDFVGEVNIGSGRQTTLEFVADHIAKALRAKLTFSNVEPAGPSHMQCDAERARRILGWEAKTSIEQGLDRTLAASK